MGDVSNQDHGARGAAAESRDCPRCGLLSPASASRCDCGYDFATARQEKSYLTDAGASSNELSGGEIALAVILPLAGVIVGMVGYARGTPNARRMLSTSAASLLFWTLTRLVLAIL